MDRYVCDACGWVYDPAVGVPEQGIEPGIPFDELPDDFECPECAAGKDEFSKEEWTSPGAAGDEKL
ncbi:MAG: rubredoxin [Pirellulales bacterium]|nr:rubredoxin [Pirellulales bacterium]